MHQVIFYSKSGNTRKIAEAIAGAVGAKATGVIGASIDPAAGVIFLGSGSYGSMPGQEWTKFVQANDFTGRKVAVFGTSGGGTGNEIRAMTDFLKNKGARVIGSYHCKGKFLLWSRGHPDAADLEAAGKFAREMVKNG